MSFRAEISTDPLGYQVKVCWWIFQQVVHFEVIDVWLPFYVRYRIRLFLLIKLYCSNKFWVICLLTLPSWELLNAIWVIDMLFHLLDMHKVLDGQRLIRIFFVVLVFSSISRLSHISSLQGLLQITLYRTLSLKPMPLLFQLSAVCSLSILYPYFMKIHGLRYNGWLLTVTVLD